MKHVLKIRMTYQYGENEAEEVLYIEHHISHESLTKTVKNDSDVVEDATFSMWEKMKRALLKVGVEI